MQALSGFLAGKWRQFSVQFTEQSRESGPKARSFVLNLPECAKCRQLNQNSWVKKLAFQISHPLSHSETCTATSGHATSRAERHRARGQFSKTLFMRNMTPIFTFFFSFFSFLLLGFFSFFFCLLLTFKHRAVQTLIHLPGTFDLRTGIKSGFYY